MDLQLHHRTMLSLLPSSSFGFVAGGLAGLQQSRSPVANVNMALDRPIRVAVIGGGPSGAWPSAPGAFLPEASFVFRLAISTNPRLAQ